jgi:magnesium chelatase subunit ChlI-like protein
MALLKKAIEVQKLSDRAYDRSLKVARTSADLSGSPDIKNISPKRFSTAAWTERGGRVEHGVPLSLYTALALTEEMGRHRLFVCLLRSQLRAQSF